MRKLNNRKHIGRKAARLLSALLILSPISIGLQNVNAEEDYVYYGNPYSGGWSNCTWAAWQLAYEHTGIALPAFGYSTDWFANAAAMGYSVGTEPRANSIGVYYGHVLYVADFDGQNIYVQEGGFQGGYNEGWSDGYSGRYGQALIGYIYLDGYVSDYTYNYHESEEDTASEATLVEDTRTPDKLIQTTPGVKLALSPNVVNTEIENLDAAIIKKYSNDTFQEVVKADERNVAEEMKQEEAASLTRVSNALVKTSTAITEIVVIPTKKK